MSETSARANRFAFAFGSFARNGLIGGLAGASLVPPAGVAGRIEGAGGAATGDVCAVIGGTAAAGLAGAGPREAGATAGVDLLGVPKGGTAAPAVGGVNGRGGGPLTGARCGTGAAGLVGR